jgi:hypothetical protein
LTPTPRYALTICRNAGDYAAPVWIPKTADELEEAVRGGDLTETGTLDFKEKLPPKSKNVDLAIDIAAMTPDGGVLIYGVG